MTSRNLTDVFILMRGNFIQHRRIDSHNNRLSDTEKLLTNGRPTADDEEYELSGAQEVIQPPWLDKLDEAHFTLSKIRPKLDELSSLHVRYSLRPTLDEKNENERLVEDLSNDIVKLISTTHRQIQYIRCNDEFCRPQEQYLTKNVVTHLLTLLQDFSIKFRTSQNQYIKHLNSLEERSNAFFDETSDFTTININNAGGSEQSVESFDNFLKPTTEPKPKFNQSMDDDFEIDQQFQRPISDRMTQQQILLFQEENERMAIEREKQVHKIVGSIVDLNDVFKELAHFVQEQGTILDRIDYNVERTHISVEEGYRQLQKATHYQRKNRKIYCIMVLASIVTVMIILLFLTKF